MMRKEAQKEEQMFFAAFQPNKDKVNLKISGEKCLEDPIIDFCKNLDANGFL